MRICFISGLYPPYSRGGAERIVSEEARALRRAGHDVSVITAAPVDEEGSFGPKTELEEGIRVRRFFPPNLFFYGNIGRHGRAVRTLWHAWDLVNPLSSRAVERILREERPEVVHTHNLKGLGFGIPGVIRKLGLKHVHTLHDVQLAVPSGLLIKGQEHSPEVEGPAARAYAAACRTLFGSPRTVISPSRFLMRFYEERGFFPRSEKVILANPAPAARRLPKAETGGTRFLFLGQIERHKGILELIAAVKKLIKKHPGVALDVVGEGAALEEAIALAGHDRRIAFFGRRNLPQLDEVFAPVDFAVVPSLCYENSPTVVGESFSHGVPVIVADIGGAAERVKDGVTGFVFEPGKASALAAALERGLKAHARWQELSSAALRAAQGYDPDSHARRLVEIYSGRDHALPEKTQAVPHRYFAGGSF